MSEVAPISPEQSSTRKDLDALKEETGDVAAILQAQKHLKDVAGKEFKSSGVVQKKGTPEFKNSVDFIKGHASDYPGNATLDETKITHMVLLTVTDEKGNSEGVVIALDKTGALLGLAD